MELEKLVNLGEKFGLSGTELKEFVDRERARLREERAAEREANREAAARLETERSVLELQLQVRQQQPNASAESGTSAATSVAHGYDSPHKLIPTFNEERDELDAYIQRFERVATSQNWPQDKWAFSLNLCLTGEALSVVGRMAADDALNYAKLKQTLLQRFRYTEEGYRTKFRGAKPENSETGRQVAGRLFGYFDNWQELAKTSRTYEALRDKIVSEQFLSKCHDKLAIFLKERGYQTLDQLAENADNYLEAQGLTNLGKRREEKESGKPPVPPRMFDLEDVEGKPHCFLCNKRGHKPADCWSKTRASTSQKTVSCFKCRKTGHKAETCPNVDSANKASCSLSRPTECRDGNEDKLATLYEQRNLALSHKTSQASKDRMPTANGWLEGRRVTVLRDSGCNTVIVNRSLVPDSKLTGGMSTVHFLTALLCAYLKPKCMLTAHSSPAT